MLRNAASLSNYPTSTWAGLPAAASAQGQIVRVTDFGVAGVGLLVISDGTRWLPLGPQVLSRGNVAASVTGTTNETVLATVTVPAGLLGVNGGLLINSTWSVTNSANNKTPRIRFGGIAGAVFMGPVVTTIATMADMRRIRNRGSASSQVAGQANAAAASIGTTSSPITTAGVDTTVAQDLVFTGQLALGTEITTLESYEVGITP